MEVIRYGQIIHRRWWLIAALVVVVGVVSVATYDWSPPGMYTARVRFNVGLEPVPPPDAKYEYNPLEVWMSSEYFMDDLASAVRGTEYARRVADRLGDKDVNLAGAFGAATEYRVLMVSVTWRDREQLARITDAAISVLNEQAGELVGPLGKARPVLRLIDPSVIVPVGRSLKDKLDVPIRVALALIVGVAGTFILDYLDTSVRDQDQVEAMGIPILARVPRQR
jgi:capsular polysaccharide biosynthesis protein